MTKEVIVTIKGLQFDTGEDESPIEVISVGTYYEKNGKEYIIYDEVMDEFQGKTRNTITIKNEKMEILRKGVSNVTMTFEKDKKNMSYYTMPMGKILLGIYTNNLIIDRQEESMVIKAFYSLEMNYEHVSECEIEIDVKSKDMANIKLNAKTGD